jgi:peptide/nickel transport system permease protein
MSINENPKHDIEKQANPHVEVVEEMQLDDARRVKVQSPGMLVFRRFIRNKLAVVGLVILFFMFSFSFLGTILTPYDQAEVFKGLGSLSKDYAGATYNTELRYTVVDGENFESAERAQFLFALGENENTFSHDGKSYLYIVEDEGFYRVIQLDPVAEIVLGGFNPIEGVDVPYTLGDAYQAAKESDLQSFELDGITYHITKNKKVTQVSTEHDVALAMINIFDAYDEADFEDVSSFEFKLASSRALVQNQEEFSVGDKNYTILNVEGKITILDDQGNRYAEVSDIIVNPLDQSLFLSVDFKAASRGAIMGRNDRFTFTHEDGEEVTYTIERVNNTYNIKKDTETLLIRMYEFSSADHPLGLDNNGMDVMTRLMYGGQVSLMVGFVVIFIEVFIGIIVGGISGYFGEWVDTALMRFVDLFNSIPFWPMVLILGSVMDTMEVEPTARIFFLMIMLGLLGWTGVARIVRGQILSLREQDFMVATEATGIKTGRRIFRHLIPNIMPLLIVYATAGLGGIIITEATLGFLGLGVKYPLASWGSIINVASDAYVMTNFWFMWIPAGTLILLTVLGFNFVGDGLRDAYDPKMKR